MPADAAGGVTRGPAAILGSAFAVGGDEQGFDDGGAVGGDGLSVVEGGLAEAQTDLGRIRRRLGADDMIDDLVAVAPSAAGAFAKRRGRAGHHVVEDGPART